MNASSHLPRFGLALALAFVVAAVAAPSLAFAEEEGPKGNVTELEINHSTSDRYLHSHGRMVVVMGKEMTEYKWGGLACGSRTLTEDLVAALQRALDTRTQIVPNWKPGQGPTRCLVGFKLSR